MRFFLLLITVAIVPLLVILHAQFYNQRQAPELQARLVTALEESGIKSAHVDLDLLDAKIRGVAPDVITAEKGHAAAARLLPARIVEDRIHILAKVQGTLSAERLVLSGWLAESRYISEIKEQLHTLRPDLTVDSHALRVDARVQKLADEKITAQSPLLHPLLETLREPLWLKVWRDAQGLHVSGLLPVGDAKATILDTLSFMDSGALRESSHFRDSKLTQTRALTDLLQSFFQQPLPRQITFEAGGKIRLQAATTYAQAGEWQRLLQPFVEKENLHLDLTYYVSEWHLPYRVLTSPLPLEKGRKLTALLTQSQVLFPRGSVDLTQQQQSQLASLVPHLVAAGPAVKLALVAYADEKGGDTRKLSFRRLETVHTFLIELGMPSEELIKEVLEATPTGTSGQPITPGMIEIFLR